MVNGHVDQLRAAGVFPEDERDTYILQVKRDGIIRDIFMFDAWYSSSEDKVEMEEAFQLMEDGELEIKSVTRRGKDYQRKDVPEPLPKKTPLIKKLPNLLLKLGKT